MMGEPSILQQKMKVLHGAPTAQYLSSTLAAAPFGCLQGGALQSPCIFVFIDFRFFFSLGELQTTEVNGSPLPALPHPT